MAQDKTQTIHRLKDLLSNPDTYLFILIGSLVGSVAIFMTTASLWFAWFIIRHWNGNLL